MGGVLMKGLAEGWGDPTSSFIVFLQACCHIPSGCALISPWYMFFSKVDNNSLIFNWNCLFLKFACKDQFPSSFYLKLCPHFVWIIFFRHEPRTVAPLQSIRWAKAFCLSCNAKCMLFLCPTSWNSLRLALKLLHSFLLFPLSTYKGQRRRKGVK